MDLAHRPETAIAFGPFKLFPSERRLERGGAAVAVGGRSLDILIALTERPGEVISKQDLFARVWPDVLVEESSLRGHVAGLRRALADGEDGVRYVANVPGRGYCFVAPLTPIAEAESSAGRWAAGCRRSCAIWWGARRPSARSPRVSPSKGS